MHRNLFAYLYFFATLFLLFPTLSYGEPESTNDTIFDRNYRDFLRLYRSGENDDAFYEKAKYLCDYYKERGQMKRYYTMQLNICLYDTEHNHPYKALKRANDMMEEMKVGHTDAYENVYLALGTVYESRGNYRMAQRYYKQALENTSEDEPYSIMCTQARLAYLLMLTNPVEAKQWNESYAEVSKTHVEYRQVYYFINGIIDLALGDKNDFYATYEAYHKDNQSIDNYGKQTLEIAKLAFDGHCDKALEQLHSGNHEFSNVAYYDVEMLLYKMMGNHTEVLESARHRAEVVDSLNSDLLYNNLNEINAQAGVSKAYLEASKARSSKFKMALVLGSIIIIILVAFIIWFRKTQQNLKEKNEQLRATLAMAEEGEKMKTEFVRSVSHEIRTPLNAINGFNDIMNTPGIELSEEERTDLTNRINENVKAITNIVDEMLHMADKEANEFNSKSNLIYPNQFFPALLYSHRDHVSGSIELNYTTRVLNRFQIKTNEEGLRKVMEQLIQNAIKFTQRGMIEVHCELSTDRNHLLVSVTDTGQGIAKEQQQKIFEGFYKADSFQQGIGLGLAVSKKIASKLGGELTLDESYTEGARFVLSLPI